MKNLPSQFLRIVIICLTLLVCVTPYLRADVTVRYEMELKPGAGLPPAMAQGMGALPPQLPAMTLQIKGHLAHSQTGDVTTIFDFEKEVYTLIDNPHKTYAVVPASEFMDKLTSAVPKLPAKQAEAARQFLSGVKVSVDSRSTGQAAAIQGVRAEEREITAFVDLPLPGALPQNGHSMKLVLQIWNPAQEENLRNPAIRQLTGLRIWEEKFLNPAGMLGKMLGSLPGATDMLAPLFAEMTKNQSQILGMHMDLYMPIMAALSQKMPAQNGAPTPAVDPNAPFMTLDEKLVELSDAPVGAALFEVPKDYTTAPADDMIKAFMNANRPTAPGAQAGTVGVDPRSAAGDGKRIHTGSDVQSAKLIRQTKPEYPPDAKAARISGSVVLDAVIAKDGTVAKLTLVSGHPSLVPAAMDAVKQWVYQPTLLNGEPVEVITQINVNFTLAE